MINFDQSHKGLRNIPIIRNDTQIFPNNLEEKANNPFGQAFNFEKPTKNVGKKIDTINVLKKQCTSPVKLQNFQYLASHPTNHINPHQKVKYYQFDQFQKSPDSQLIFLFF